MHLDNSVDMMVAPAIIIKRWETNVVFEGFPQIGLLVEVHHDPDHALSDGAQSLKPQQFAEMMQQIRMIASAVGRTL